DLALNMDNVFQADDYDAFDSDVDEAPTTQTLFMANLSSTDLVYDDACPSYDLDVLSEVYDHDHYQDAVCEHHEVHEIHDDVQPNYVVKSHTDYTSDSNMIPYDLVDRIEDRGTMHEVQVQLVMGELRIELDVLSEVYDHDHYQDAVCEHHEVHEIHDDVQPNYVVKSHTDYTSDSNMIPYDLYVKDNAVQVVQSNVSAVPNDAYMMILNDMHEPPAQHVFVTTQNKVVDKSFITELATYKEHVELYERRSRFKLTERKQKIDEQLRTIKNSYHRP
nr:hypothetical protein [Tanacetum cinerariifolium]